MIITVRRSPSLQFTQASGKILKRTYQNLTDHTAGIESLLDSVGLPLPAYQFVSGSPKELGSGGSLPPLGVSSS